DTSGTALVQGGTSLPAKHGQKRIDDHFWQRRASHALHGPGERAYTPVLPQPGAPRCGGLDAGPRPPHVLLLDQLNGRQKPCVAAEDLSSGPVPDQRGALANRFSISMARGNMMLFSRWMCRCRSVSNSFSMLK